VTVQPRRSAVWSTVSVKRVTTRPRHAPKIIRDNVRHTTTDWDVRYVRRPVQQTVTVRPRRSAVWLTVSVRRVTAQRRPAKKAISENTIISITAGAWMSHECSLGREIANNDLTLHFRIVVYMAPSIKQQNRQYNSQPVNTTEKPSI